MKGKSTKRKPAKKKPAPKKSPTKIPGLLLPVGLASLILLSLAATIYVIFLGPGTIPSPSDVSTHQKKNGAKAAAADRAALDF